MSSSESTPDIKVTDPRKEQVKFVTHLLVSGCVNGVINLTLGTAQFSTPDCVKVETDVVVATRLRVDLFTAQILRDRLDELISANTKPAAGDPIN